MGRPDAAGPVLDHLLADASARGTIALSGRLEPARAQTLSEKGCLLSLRGYWTLIQSRRPELLHAIQRGDAILSRLDGEWPLRFQ